MDPARCLPHHTNPTLFQQIKTWFHNRGRATGSSKGYLKLDVPEGRKLAPLQAYCSYEWDTLQSEVIARWEKEKATNTFEDDDDPPVVVGRPTPEAFIPLSFKLKVVKESYEKLSTARKGEIDRRRDNDRGKVHRKIPDITDERERIEKLQSHNKFRDIHRCTADLFNLGSSGTSNRSQIHWSVSLQIWRTRQAVLPIYSSLLLTH